MKKKLIQKVLTGKNIREILFGPENSLSDTQSLNKKHNQTANKRGKKEKKQTKSTKHIKKQQPNHTHIQVYKTSTVYAYQSKAFKVAVLKLQLQLVTSAISTFLDSSGFHGSIWLFFP